MSAPHLSQIPHAYTRTTGVQTNGLELAKLGSAGIRGVRASTACDANVPLTTVPHKLVLETTTLHRTPPKDLMGGWVDPEFYGGATWYVRLALILLRQAELGGGSALAPWIDVLPESFDELPLHWSDDEVCVSVHGWRVGG